MEIAPSPEHKPPWLKVRLPGGETYQRLKGTISDLSLVTVCQQARCPNVGECWNAGTATFMLMGDVCTRGCRFCAVKTARRGAPLDRDEPEKVAEAVVRMGLSYVVLTSVDRDDLPDGGAGHIARTVEIVHARLPGVLVEALVPDFQGDPAGIARLVESGAEVIGQNLETVRRLTHPVRDPRASYETTLAFLARVKKLDPRRFTKSSLMLGLGEEPGEVLAAMDDLRRAGVELLTLGQYLRPTPRHLPVVEYVPPARFDRYRDQGLAKGFAFVAAGPLVRSSYRAGEFYVKSLLGSRLANQIVNP